LLRRTRAVLPREERGATTKRKATAAVRSSSPALASGRAQPPKRERPSSKGKAENDELRLLTQLHTQASEALSA
jgi:hypothetical protein